MRAATILSTALLAGCGAGRVVPAAPDDPPFIEPAEPARELYGTARDDLWRAWQTVDVNAAQYAPRHAFLTHDDGHSSVDVAVPAIFTEASCGVPAAFAAPTPGELWLASYYVPACGDPASGLPAQFRIVLGRLSRDGTWTDRSADLPELVPPAGYSAVELHEDLGVLVLNVREREAYGPETFRSFLVTDDATTELPDVGWVQPVVVDDAHVYLLSGMALTHQLVDGAPVPLAAPIAWPGYLLAHGPEVWAFNANDVVQQEQNRVAWRFDGTAFQPVPFTVEDAGTGGLTWQAVGLVPRGNGEATLVGQRMGSGIYAYSEHAVTARELSGGALTGDDVIYGTLKCDADLTEDCLRMQSRRYATLHDGTIVLQSPSSTHGQFLSLITPDAIP